MEYVNEGKWNIHLASTYLLHLQEQFAESAIKSKLTLLAGANLKSNTLSDTNKTKVK